MSVHVCSTDEQGYSQFAHAACCMQSKTMFLGCSQPHKFSRVASESASADSCLNMLWLLFLTPGPSRILKLSGLQHKHVHVMLLCNINRRRLLSWYKLQTSPVICPENHLHPHPCDAAWEGRLLGKVRWKKLSLGTSLSSTGTNHASLICEFVVVGLLKIDYGEVSKASRPVARRDYGYVVLLGLLYMTKQPPHADCLYLLGPPKSRNNARSEIC